MTRIRHVAIVTMDVPDDVHPKPTTLDTEYNASGAIFNDLAARWPGHVHVRVDAFNVSEFHPENDSALRAIALDAISVLNRLTEETS